MKLKKILSAIAIGLGVSVLSCCAGTSKTPFGNYWNENALTAHEAIHETLVYDISFTKGSTYGYELDYEKGTLTTVLQSSRDEQGNTIYLYTSELSVDVVYKLGESSTTLTDLVKTEVRFRSADKGLTPISAKKSVVSSSPRAVRPTAIEECYTQYNYEFTTTYEGNGGKTTLTRDKDTTKERTTEQSFEIKDEAISYVDNEQLLLALRAMPTSVTSTKLLAYSPFYEKTQSVNVSFKTAEEGKFELSKNGGEKTEQTINYRPVQIQLDERDPGLGQLLWIASSTDSAGKNVHRNVILRHESPLYQGMGTLVYELRSVNYQ